MRIHIAIVSIFCAVGAARADMHSCQADPPVVRIYSRSKGSPDRVKILREGLIAHPDDLFLNRWLMLSDEVRPGSLAAEYRRKLDEHPGDPLFLYLYGHSLMGSDTPESIRLIGEALAKDPELTYGYQTLLEIYGSPRFRDRAKIAENLRAYAARCPEEVDDYQYLRDVEDPATLKELTAQFRAAVDMRSTVGVAAVYVSLWAAEFRVADPATYDKLREQVPADMKRIRELDPNNTNNGKSLAEGYRLLGDKAAADAVLAKRTPPRTFFNVFEEWRKASPQVIDYAGMLDASAQWVKDFPNETNAWYWRMAAVANRKESTPREIEKAGDDVLASDAKTFQGWSSDPYPLTVAEIWAEHDIRLSDCIGLLRRAAEELEGSSTLYDDRRPVSTAATVAPARNIAITRFRMWGVEAQVDRKLKDNDAARAVLARMKSWIDEHPEDAAWQTMLWHQESGMLAEAEGHKPDALAHYQLGIQTASDKTRAQALWAEMGGTEEGFEIWWKRPEVPQAPLTIAAVWSPKTQSLVALNAKELGGKTWTIADLRGKKTLINVWATWCAPCRAELPAVQKLYELTKGRGDIQVITINVDSDPGLAGPFVEAERYTFPVLLAKTLVDDMSEEAAIPRNWIVDEEGVVREECLGYYAADWPEKIRTRLAGVR